MNPQSTLKRMTEHPIFPKVKIQHGSIPGLVASTEDMSAVIINANVPTTVNVNGKRIPTAAPLAVYELYSRAGIEILREAAAAEGHQADDRDIETVARRDVGEQAEKHFLAEHYQFTEEDWNTYVQLMEQAGGRSFAVTSQQPPDDSVPPE